MKTFLKITVFIAFVFTIFFCQKNIFVLQREIDRQIVEHPLFIPDSSAIKFISLGYDVLVADLIWLDAVQYIGEHITTMDKDILFQYLDLITDLDPHFEYAYIVGEFLLPEKNSDNKKTFELARKGMIYNKKNWQIPFYLAFMYQFYDGNFKKAANYYLSASQIEGSPPVAKTLAASSTVLTNDHVSALKIWKDIYNTVENPFTKSLAEKNIIRENNILILEKARNRYKELYKTELSDINDLVKTKILHKIPKDPQNFEYLWNKDTREFEIM